MTDDEKKRESLARIRERLSKDPNARRRVAAMVMGTVAGSDVQVDARSTAFDDLLVDALSDNPEGACVGSLEMFVTMLKLSVQPSLDRLVAEGRLRIDTDETGEVVYKAAPQELQ